MDIKFSASEAMIINNEIFKNQVNLKNYAKLLVHAGNVQKGQTVVIISSIYNAFFAHMVMESSYDAGACEVTIWWDDDYTLRTKYMRASDQVFDTYPQWNADRYKYYDDKCAVYLHIHSPDPNLLASVSIDRLNRASLVTNIANKPHMDLIMKGDIRWSVLALPNAAWTKTVFPKLAEQNITEAIIKLLELIMKASRADGDNPIDDWKKHRQNFENKVSYLNKQKFHNLRITTGLGTNIVIGLVYDHIWVGGGIKDKKGLYYFPNIPTEEVFTMPDKNNVFGKVVASKPLSYQGILIEGIELEFVDGVVTNFNATKNREVLADIINHDDGAKRLGEIAIVANSSPINQMGVLFYNTLFDENASSHLALGKAYPKNIKDGTQMTQEQLSKLGVNNSLIHVDFMFGTADMQITGIKADDSEVVFFKNGEFVT